MSGQLGEGVQIVGQMVALRDDGSPAPILWLAWPGEAEDDASAFEVVKTGGLVRLVPCELGKLADWRRVAAMTAEGG